jgi:hypothetical protein
MSKREELLAAREAWSNLAEQESQAAILGIKHPLTAAACRDAYLRTVKAIDIQLETGVAVCSCHFKPFKESD